MYTMKFDGLSPGTIIPRAINPPAIIQVKKFASTVMIIPTNYAGFDIVQYLACVVMLGFGTWLGAFMAKLEDTYK